MPKRALITGIRGQDGAYLSKWLLEKGYEVFGVDRRSGDSDFWRLKELGIQKDVKILYMDLLELTNIMCTVEKIMPDEVYNLAAQSFVQGSFEQPILTADIDGMGVLRLLEAMRRINPTIKLYQASSSEMFGKVQQSPQDEFTQFYPRSPYGVAKVFGHWTVVNYRESYNMFGCSGILFNHESPLRGLEFVTRKITNGVARIRAGIPNSVVLGNLDAKRDWGYAAEYVTGMWLMLQQPKPDDFVLATGETHTIREFAEAAFKAGGYELTWRGEGIDTKGIDKKSGKILVEVSSEFYRPAEANVLHGNPNKAKQMLGWSPKVQFLELVSLMVEADIKRVEQEAR